MFCEQTEQEREVQKGDVDLSVIVPFYNESGTPSGTLCLEQDLFS